MELHMNPVGWNFANANSGGGAFRELGGKCLVTHFPVAIQSCLNEALSFHTPTLMHCQGQRLLAHMSHLDSFTLLFQQWDTCVTSLWPSSKIRSPSAPPPTFKSINSSRAEVHHCGRLPGIGPFEVATTDCMWTIPKGVNTAKETLV